MARNQRNHGYSAVASDLAARHRRANVTRPVKQHRGGFSSRRNARNNRSTAVIFSNARYIGHAVLAFGLAVAIIAGIAYAYRSFATSQLFALRNLDLQGQVRAPRQELLSVLNEQTSHGLWWADIDEVREKLRRYPWVRDAEVTRILPDTLRVRISEREPYALARLSDGSLVWVDRDGVMLDQQGTFKDTSEVDRGLPLLSGLAEGTDDAAREINRQRLITYQEVIADIEQGAPPMLDYVDEIHFDEVDGVHLQLAGRRVKVITKPANFHSQLKKALNVLEAIDQKDVSRLELFRITDTHRLLGDVRISYINTRSPDRVIIGLAQ